MDRDAHAEFLGDLEHLDRLDQDGLHDLLEICEERTLVSGEPLWSTGDVGDAGYVLVSGRVELTWRAPQQGREQKQVTQPGSWMGLAYLVADWEHESSAYPLERTVVLEIEREAFQELFDQQHPAAYRLTDIIAEALVEEVRDANERLQQVFGHPAETLRTLRRRTTETKRS